MTGLRVLLVDDDPVVRDLLGRALREEPDVGGVDLCADGRSAIAHVQHHEVDAVLLDVDMPGLDGPSTARRIREVRPAVAVVMLTALAPSDALGASLDAGARGYLSKDTLPGRIVQYLFDAIAGRTVMGPEATDLLAAEYLKRTQTLEAADNGFVEAVTLLKPYLREVFDLLALGSSNAAISQALHLKSSTTRVYVSEVVIATGCETRSEVAVRAAATGLSSVHRAHGGLGVGDRVVAEQRKPR